MQIGFDYELKKQHEKEVALKQQLFIDAEGFFRQYDLELNDAKKGHDSFTEYFKAEFLKKYSDRFPKFLTVHEMMSTWNVSIRELTSIEEQYKAIRCPFDPLTQDIRSDVNYEIHTTNDTQTERYKIAQDMIELIGRMDAIGDRVNSTHLQTALRGLIATDRRSGELIPNINAVLK